MSAFGVKADMTFAGSALSRSLLGVKRTSLFATHMYASDPKRTCLLHRKSFALGVKATLASLAIQGVATPPEYEEDALQDPRNRF